jgi:hypothetical protein
MNESKAFAKKQYKTERQKFNIAVSPCSGSTGAYNREEE